MTVLGRDVQQVDVYPRLILWLARRITTMKNLVGRAVSLLLLGAVAIAPFFVQSFAPSNSRSHKNGLVVRRHGKSSFGKHDPRCTATTAATTTTTTTRLWDRPFGIMVQAEIEPDRLGEFMIMIEQNAIKSRQEPGCMRFDVLRSDDSETTFFFYEVYQNVAAVEEHKKQEHYQKWAAFKESGGTISSTSFKLHGEFMT
jgi:(4S)-4-hydroxy-5-phosphonooxypentane-2,3-dione isomerase